MLFLIWVSLIGVVMQLIVSVIGMLADEKGSARFGNFLGTILYSIQMFVLIKFMLM